MVSVSRIIKAAAITVMVSGCGVSEGRLDTLRQEELKSLSSSLEIPSVQLTYYESGKDYQTFLVSNDPTVEPDKRQVYQAASLSKVVFSYIVMRLYDEGKIDLDAPVCSYTDIDRFEDKQMASRLTPRIILSHTSGLYNWAYSPTSEAWKSSTIRFHRDVDACYGYSGEAFAFLQRAVESITGKSLDQVAREYVFSPFDMPLSSYTWQKEYDVLAMTGHDREGNPKGLWEGIEPNCAYTLRTTSEEFMNFLVRAMINGEGLSEKTHSEWLTPRSEAIRFADSPRECDKDMYWALGVGVRTVQGTEEPKVYWHWGDNDYWKSLFIVDLKNARALDYFTDSQKGHDFCDDICSLFLSGSYNLREWIGDRDDD